MASYLPKISFFRLGNDVVLGGQHGELKHRKNGETRSKRGKAEVLGFPFFYGKLPTNEVLLCTSFFFLFILAYIPFFSVPKELKKILAENHLGYVCLRNGIPSTFLVQVQNLLIFYALFTH